MRIVNEMHENLENPVCPCGFWGWRPDCGCAAGPNLTSCELAASARRTTIPFFLVPTRRHNSFQNSRRTDLIAYSQWGSPSFSVTRKTKTPPPPLPQSPATATSNETRTPIPTPATAVVIHQSPPNVPTVPRMLPALPAVTKLLLAIQTRTEIS